MNDKTTPTGFLSVVLFVPVLVLVGLFSSGGSDLGLFHVRRDILCVTEGAIGQTHDQQLSVDTPKMRAYVTAWSSQTIEAQFIYLGSTGNEARLGSGELRRQFGLKLRAQDPCNLVYAMWRIEPESRLVVSVKANPGQHTSGECGNRGYRNIKPIRSTQVPLLRPGDSHILRAEMNGEQLRVWADKSVVWEGTVGPEALQIDGPVGIRSDNAKLVIELQVGEFPGNHPMHLIPCKSESPESE